LNGKPCLFPRTKTRKSIRTSAITRRPKPWWKRPRRRLPFARRERAFTKILAIAEIEAGLQKLAESTDGKADREALDAIEKAVRGLKERALRRIYPVEDLKVPVEDLKVKEKKERK
jgi:hypothetical protein